MNFRRDYCYHIQYLQVGSLPNQGIASFLYHTSYGRSSTLLRYLDNNNFLLLDKSIYTQ